MSTLTNAPVHCGKRLTPRRAIRTYCRWCNGGSTATCVSSACVLFPYRADGVTSEAKVSPLRSIRAKCRECAGGVEAVRTCTAHKPFSETQPECPLWPHRDGKRNVTLEYREQRREQAKKQRGKSGPGAPFKPKQLTKEQSLGVGSPGPSVKVFQLDLFHSPGGGA